jgi:hypothetical protein
MRLWVGLALITGLSAPAIAQQEIPAVRALLALAIRPDADFSRAGRVRFTEALGTFCRDVAAAIPTNTPRETDWVLAEMKTSDINRIKRLARSAEYSRHYLSDIFKECNTKVA